MNQDEKITIHGTITVVADSDDMKLYKNTHGGDLSIRHSDLAAKFPFDPNMDLGYDTKTNTLNVSDKTVVVGEGVTLNVRTKGIGDQRHIGNGDQYHYHIGDQYHYSKGKQVHTHNGNQTHFGEGDQLTCGNGNQDHAGNGQQEHRGIGEQIHEGKGNQFHFGKGAMEHYGSGWQYLNGEIQERNLTSIPQKKL